MGGPKRGSGTRSNWYSRSKYTNWMPFDPYWSEAKAAVLSARAAATVEANGQSSPIPIFCERPHERFIQPCTASEVREVLMSCPSKFLHGLRSVHILSGTSKQEKALGLLHYGTYSPQRIFLHAYPKRLMEQRYATPPPPHIRRTYERFGAQVKRCHGGWSLRFDARSLRLFYLFDVLLHELGHHVDKHVFSRTDASAERYAEWFADAQARQIAGSSDGLRPR